MHQSLSKMLYCSLYGTSVSARQNEEVQQRYSPHELAGLR